MSAARYLRGFPGLLRRIADRLDPAGAPRSMSFAFTFEHGRGIVFREGTNRGCPLWYLGSEDYERAHDEAEERECQGADFSKLLQHLGGNLREHARRDGLSPVRTAIFLDRGGHAPGERCPSEAHAEPIHDQSCDLLYDGDECTCGAGVMP